MQQEDIKFPGSKPHYESLDGLRGIAAICVVIFHFFEFIFPSLNDNPLGHGFLAVDFFFCLSGFVIGYAYDARINKMGIGKFLRNRLIRLHPMVIFGSVLGLFSYVLNPFANDMALAGWGKIMLSFICSLLLFPWAILPNRADNVFPLNPPTWSLSTEYLANIFYAFVLSRVSKKVLVVLFAAAAIWLVYIAKAHGGVLMGWEYKFYFDGWARTAFSFMYGLLIYRFQLIIKNKISALLLFAALIGVFAFPHTNNDWVTELLLVMLIMPAILCLAAGHVVTGYLKSVCNFLGRLSYPLYMVHYFVIWPYGDYINKHKPEATEVWLLTAALFASVVLLSYIIMRFYDEPLRKYLITKWAKPVQ